MKYALALAAITAAACGSGGGDAGRPPPAPTTVLTVDAGVIDAGITTITAYDPASGFALDPDPGTDPTRPPRPSPRSSRERRTVQILLRSTPIGALAQVDGQLIGKTPQLWEGEGGRAHTFTFSLTGHAPARYEFVTLTDGVVHSRLLKAAGPTVPPPPIGPPPSAPPERAAPPPPIVRPPPPTIDAAMPPPPPVIDAAEPSPPPIDAP